MSECEIEFERLQDDYFRIKASDVETGREVIPEQRVKIRAGDMVDMRIRFDVDEPGCTHGIGPGTLAERVGLRGTFVCPHCKQTVTHPEPVLTPEIVQRTGRGRESCGSCGVDLGDHEAGELARCQAQIRRPP